jgi:DNA-binding transcriptional MerR regulator
MTLTPDSQRALDAELGLQAGRSELGASLLPRAQDEFGQAMDWNQFEEGGGNVQGGSGYNQQAEDALFNRWSSRALPQQERDTARLETQLANMGLQQGDAAYDEEMRKMRETQGDALQQAQYQATIGAGGEASRMQGQDVVASELASKNRQQQIVEEMTKRGFSLNEINAIISGQQVATPQMPGFNTASRAEGPQTLQAAQMTGQAELDRYNAQQQATQGMMSGIGSMAGGFMMSDRRFKREIERVGTTAGGTPLYSFRYIFGGPKFIGVMADEVPHAVTKIAGISFVDYSKVK